MYDEPTLDMEQARALFRQLPNPCPRGPRSSELLIDARAKIACPGPRKN